MGLGSDTMVNRIVEFCYKLCNNEIKDNWTHLDDFLLHTVHDGEEFIQMEALNRNHTVLFKIRVKRRDLGLIFKYPCIYTREDFCLQKWKLRRLDMTQLRDKSYIDLLTFEDVFDIEYDSFDYSELVQLLDTTECNQIEIRNNSFSGVYSSYLIRSAIIDDGVEDIKLKLISYDCPLRLNYKIGIFDVYCLIAPKLEVKEDLFFLRV